MKQQSHKPEIHENYLMRRRVKLAGADENRLDELRQHLEQETGVDSVAVDVRKARLNVVYDASIQNLDHLLDLVQTFGLEVAHNRWQDYKLSWYRYGDENVRENATSAPWSCHQTPPPQVRRPRR